MLETQNLTGPNARIVYIDGAFDLFHAGHVEILRLARKLGDFLLVGIHTDQTVGSEVLLSHPQFVDDDPLLLGDETSYAI
ncbi:hypothetical protein K1719_039463 [Acacia pycnantha]|nr:hypothetical protein K1719_039463 [Acacia pycnantha]